MFLGLLRCAFTLTWFATAIAGYFLFFATLFPLIFIYPKWYRLITDCVSTFWQSYISVLDHIALQLPFDICGDRLRNNETVILISNHRTRVDWNFLWPAIWYAMPDGPRKLFNSTKFMLKYSIKFIPCIGWLMHLCSYLFIHRNWEKDKKIINDYVNYITKTNYKHIMVMFPEGTDFTMKTKLISDRYAEMNHLQKYEHVLHPHKTGFTYMVHQMLKNKCLDAVYDVTLIYPSDYPQNELELFLTFGGPEAVLTHFKRYSAKDLPQTEKGLGKFLENCWHEKEESLKTLYKTGNFYSNAERFYQFNAANSIIIIFIWNTIIVFFLFRHAIANEWFRFIVFYETLVLLGTYILPDCWQTYDLIACGKTKRRILGPITIAPHIAFGFYLIKGISFTFFQYIETIILCMVFNFRIYPFLELFLKKNEIRQESITNRSN